MTGDVYDVQISSASMTGRKNINPEAKLFYLHPDTYDVLDVDTFYLDLQNPQSKWTLADLGSWHLISHLFYIYNKVQMLHTT